MAKNQELLTAKWAEGGKKMCIVYYFPTLICNRVYSDASLCEEKVSQIACNAGWLPWTRMINESVAFNRSAEKRKGGHDIHGMALCSEISAFLSWSLLWVGVSWRVENCTHLKKENGFGILQHKTFQWIQVQIIPLSLGYNLHALAPILTSLPFLAELPRIKATLLSECS